MSLNRDTLWWFCLWFGTVFLAQSAVLSVLYPLYGIPFSPRGAFLIAAVAAGVAAVGWRGLGVDWTLPLGLVAFWSGLYTVGGVAKIRAGGPLAPQEALALAAGGGLAVAAFLQMRNAARRSRRLTQAHPPGFPNIKGRGMRGLFQRLEGARSLDEPGRQSLYRDVRDRASDAPEDFERAMHVLPLDQASCLFEVYEALAPDPRRHGELLVNEAWRLLGALEDEPRARHPRDALEAMTFVEDRHLRARLADELILRATSESSGVRRAVAWLLPSLADPDTARPVLERLAKDKEWRVRVLADIGLAESGGPSRLRLPDRIRSRFVDVHG